MSLFRRRLISARKKKEIPVQSVYEFPFTGTVQQVTLSRGRYKLQCWGAQGGGRNSYFGALGGYSEGVLNINTPTTIYVFVGGEGENSNSSSKYTVLFGGWNGGGSSRAYSEYTDDEYNTASSYPRPGGGATDMCLISSNIGYGSDRRTTRDSLSLLSRFIVAGGGAGSSENRGRSNHGGGVRGLGEHGGTQNSAGAYGTFGLGANQGHTNYKYESGAGGAGWYGGGCSYSDDNSSARGYSGGGSGFVNIAANAQYRPSGYTGIELESGTTLDGAQTFESPTGGTETGHAGDGYARITQL